MKKLITFTFALLLAVGAIGMISNSAKAVVLQVVGGQLVGAQGVDVNGTLYDVTFGAGTCVAIYDNCDNAATDFQFQTQSDAEAAGQALLDQVLLDGGLGNFDTLPALTQGCTQATICQIKIPYELSGPSTVFLTFVNNHFEEVNDLVDPNQGGWDKNVTNDGISNFTWAQFSPSIIPIPPALLLFLSGLVAFFGVARVGRRGVKAEA